jgi:hypothetical protein
MSIAVLQRKRCCVRAGAAFLFLLCGASIIATAATLEDYRRRLNEATSALEAAYKNAEPVEISATFLKMRELLPKKERIERASGTIDVDNEWLHLALDEYSANSLDYTPAQRSQALLDIADRLHALDDRLGEITRPQDARNKDAEKGRLATILRGEAYNRKPAEGGALARLLQQIMDWLRELFPRVGPIKPGAGGRPSPVLQVVVFGIALLIVAFILWKFWVRRRDRIKPASLKEARVVLGERIAPDVTALDLLAEAEMLAREGELRGAIRKAYVALLIELGDRHVIRLAQHKTNRDYLRALRTGAPAGLYDEMEPLTVNFERHWYGLEQASQTDWTDFRTRCKQALRTK